MPHSHSRVIRMDQRWVLGKQSQVRDSWLPLVRSDRPLNGHFQLLGLCCWFWVVTRAFVCCNQLKRNHGIRTWCQYQVGLLLSEAIMVARRKRRHIRLRSALSLLTARRSPTRNTPILYAKQTTHRQATGPATHRRWDKRNTQLSTSLSMTLKLSQHGAPSAMASPIACRRRKSGNMQPKAWAPFRKALLPGEYLTWSATFWNGPHPELRFI